LIFESDERDTSVWPMTLAVVGSILLHAGLLLALPAESLPPEERLSQLAIDVTLVTAVAPPEEPAPPGAMDAAVPVQPAPALEALALEDCVTLAEAPPAVTARELTPMEAADPRSPDVLDRVQAPPTRQPVRQAPPRAESRHHRVAVATTSTTPGEPARWSDAAANATQLQAQQDYVLQVVHKLSHRQFYAKEDREGTAVGVMVARLTVARDGALVDLSLAKDSGSAGLDGSVLDTIRKAAPFAPLPRDFARSSFTFIVPINYAQER
jgi:periplasmic protein TonB